MIISKYNADLHTTDNTPSTLIVIPLTAQGSYYVEYRISVISDDKQATTFMKEGVSVRNDGTLAIAGLQQPFVYPPNALGTSLASNIAASISGGTDFTIVVTGLTGTGNTDNLNWAIYVEIMYLSV